MSTKNRTAAKAKVSIDLSPLQLKEIKALLGKYLPNTTVWAYGSRVKGNARSNSDLDMVAFASPEQAAQLSLLREALEESNLPFTVDFFVWDSVPEKFKANIQREYIELQSGEVERDVRKEEWPRAIISDVCELIVDCVNKTAPVVEGPTPFKMIRTPNVKNGVVNTDTCRFVESATFEKWTRRADVKAGDVLLTREAPLGEVGIVMSEEKLFLGQRLMQYRTDPQVLDSKFLLYSFLSHDLQHQFSMHEGSGSVVSHIRVGDCLKFELNLPALDEQKRISHVLGSIDKKIQLNRQTNQTLEQMAQTLFKSWFVDFDPVIDNALAAGKPIPDALQERAQRRQQQLARPDHKPLPDEPSAGLPKELRQLFPSEFELTEELGWVPLGWEVKQIKDFGDIVCGKTPSKKDPNNFGGKTPFIKIPDTHGKVYPIHTADTLSDQGANSQPKKEIPAGSVCVSSIATVGKVVIAPYASHTNQQINTVVPFSLTLTPYIYFAMLELEDVFHDLASGGSATLNMNTSVFSKTRLLMPSEKTLFEFYSQVKEYFTKILSLEENSMYLEQLRDTLLPKLISGELRLPSKVLANAEQQFTEARA